MRFLLLLFFYLACLTGSFAQQYCLGCSQDSIRKLLELPLEGEDRIRVLEVAMFGLGEWEDILEVAKELEQYPTFWNAPAARTYRLCKEGAEAYLQGNLEVALEKFKASVIAGDKEGMIYGQESPLAMIRFVFRQKNEDEALLEYYRSRLAYYQEFGPEENLAVCFHGIAGYYYYGGNYNNAIGYYLRAAEIYKRFAPEAYGNELAVVGNIYGEWGNQKKAIFYNSMALPILKQSHTYPVICYVVIGLAETYVSQGKIDSAFQRLTQVLSLVEEEDPKPEEQLFQLEVLLLLEIGKTFIAGKLPQRALTYFQKARELGELANMPFDGQYNPFEIDYAFYSYHRMVGNPSLAESYLLKALSKSQAEKAPPLTEKYFKELFLFYQSQQQHELAAHYASKYISLSDSLRASNDKNVIALYEVEQKELESRLAIEQAEMETRQAYQEELTRRNYLLFGFLGLGLIAFIFFRYRGQLRRKLAEAESQRLKELDEVKTQLYTNITHEFRTPLTIIQGMAQKIEEKPEHFLGKGISMIQRNSRHLLRLVNQLLDLAKLESGSLSLNQIQADIVPYLFYLVESFHSYAETRGVVTHTWPHVEELIMDYDPDRIQDIISNLLSNAIKFTPEGGKVFVSFLRDGDFLEIHVGDTGIGIPKEKLPYIFDRFYQADDSSIRSGEGTGVGLALTRELVKLMGGEIGVESVVGKGTEFTVRLPITHEAPLMAYGIPEQVSPRSTSTQETRRLISHIQDPALPLALLVDDNEDVITYLISCLETGYRLEVARDGQEGIEKALELVPDIIVSDVMMPHKDGFELTDTLKHDMRTSHIPIVLLTAKADVASRLAGLKRGADAYLAKPFNEEELQIRMAKLLELRNMLRQRYASPEFLSEDLPESPGAETEPEDAFISQTRTVIYDHLDDPELDVTKLCRELGMSRSPLHNKLKALTGMSTTGFIRFVRLTKAREMLRKTDAPVSEIAYKTGFQNHNYFSKKFRELFGRSPSGFRE